MRAKLFYMMEEDPSFFRIDSPVLFPCTPFCVFGVVFIEEGLVNTLGADRSPLLTICRL